MSRTERRRDALILDEDPDLGEDLDREQFAHAREHLVARTASYPSGGWPVEPDAFDGRRTLGLLVIDGLLVRGVTVGDYTCAELLGPGDILQPWLRLGPEQSVPTEVDWDVVDPVRIAILDRDLVRATARWPEVSVAISRRIMQRAHWLAFHLAVCGLRRVEERLLVVLWHFADRWGSVTPDRVRLDLRLTHETLAGVIGARRPSVSAAITRLTGEGRLRSLPRSRWLLLGTPPAQLKKIHQRPPGAPTGRES